MYISSMGSIINLDLVKNMSNNGNLHLCWVFHVVNRICADNGAWMEQQELLTTLEEYTGKSRSTTRIWINNLLNKKLIRRTNGIISIKSKYKLAIHLGYGSSARRSIRLEDLSDYNNFKSEVILATHRYIEDKMYAMYYDMKKHLYSQGNLTPAKEWAFPSERKKVGCGGEYLADYMGLSYSTIYNVLKGNVKKQWNYWFLTEGRFNKEFGGMRWFIQNPRFRYRRDVLGYLITCQISSKSLYTGLFNVSRSRLDFDDAQILEAGFLPHH